MIRRTIPAVSFTPSHRALMIRVSKPLLSGEMNSNQRLRAAWNEIPFTTWFMSRAQVFEWHWRIRYDLGLRDMKTFTKARLYFSYVAYVACLLAVYKILSVNYYYFPVHQSFPEYMKRENSAEWAKAQGKEVWCADGKFVTPYFHINPPMLTMTMDEL
eukprot:GILI01006107.1.p1 GENE.GILI01006107.1~~GILI01006107.1.p1  ORF type:complete len:167 (+),score=33.63 GILI01006107.1:30-503(+)